MKTVLASGLAQDYLVSLDKMMPSLAKLKNAEEVQLAYAEVATMVDYMTALQGESVLAKIIDDFAKGLPVDAVLKKRLGMGLDAFQENWKIFVKEKKFATIPGLKPFKFRFKNNRSRPARKGKDEADRQGAAEAHAEDLTRLGDILKSRDYLEAATVEYEKAIEESQTISPILNNKLAATYLLRKEYAKAETLLNKNIKSYPSFSTTEVNLGELYYLQGKLETSLRHYERAVRLNPFNPYVHSRLIDIMDKLERDEEKDLQARLFSQIE